MNTQSSKQQSVVNVVDHNALVLHEQLALKRLRELQQEVKPNRLLTALLLVLRALIKKPELVREIAPGQVSLDWHEVEGARRMRALNIM